MKTLQQFMTEISDKFYRDYPGKKKKREWVQKAHLIIGKHGDPDMSKAEILSLLKANGIPRTIAHEVAGDYR